jgi:peptidoglycan/xylan/chitin deacetylase (PgdA/CDA1 family)
MFTKNSLPILTFHAIDERQSVISFPPYLFKRVLSRLKANDYKTIGLLEAVDYLKRGLPFPERSFAITFDDGYDTVYHEAFPILQQYGMSATVFLTVGEGLPAKLADRLPGLEGRRMLSWDQIKEMHQSSISIGAHTLTHPDLTSLPYDRIHAEICESKSIIEETLRCRVDCFAYPYGRFNQISQEIVQNYFTCACSDKLGVITNRSDVFALERVDAYYLRSDRLIEILSTKHFPWYIKARSIPRSIRRFFSRMPWPYNH